MIETLTQTTVVSKIELAQQLKSQLDACRPLPAAAVAELRQRWQTVGTYNSAAIEGNTLTQSETELVVTKGITVGGKSLIDHLEVTNLAIAQDFVFDLASSDTELVSERVIRQLHQIVMSGTTTDLASVGAYRKINVRAAGSGHDYPEALRVTRLMVEFIDWLSTALSDSSNALVTTTDAHYRFVAIHPFADGNGRVGRLLMNLLLIRSGYPPLTFLVADRQRYIDALQYATKNNGDIGLLTDLAADCAVSAIKDTLQILGRLE